MTETPRKRPPEEVSTNQSEDQSESRVIIVSTPKTKAPPVLPREITKSPEDVIIIDSGTGEVADGEGGTLVFVLKVSSAFLSAAYIQVHFRLSFIMEANTMAPDQTAP